ncbi:MAG: glycosyltransferase [Deltaproteobacteria bacterium]|nr:glycosyltransferase [Deltaproteobacteria bacterium]
MRALYISHIGMTEPLGQSQVLPYLRGVAASGARIRILSFERATTTPEAIASLQERMRADGLQWEPLVRSAGHGLPVKVAESSLAVLRGLRVALSDRPDVVHARSYLPAAAADVIASVSPRSKLLFDCRGMLGDEYVDNGQWTEDRLEYKLLKRFERRVFRRAEGVVVLTRALRAWLGEHAMLGPRTNVEVIPCCVDMKRFSPSPTVRAEMRAELGIGDRLALVYSGSLGSWYLEDEMARYAAHVQRAAKDAGREMVVLVLSPSDHARFRGKLEAAGFGTADLLFRQVPPAKMAAHLAAGDIGLSFIQSCFSKKGSSPTKVAEYLASGLVVTLNGDIGDQTDLAAEREACVVLESYDDGELAEAARRAVALAARPYEERAAIASGVARSHFGLAEVGVPRYVRLYRSLV